MNHLKTFEGYNNPYDVPGPDVQGSKLFYLDKDEVDLFHTESELLELIEFGTVNIIGNEMWYFEKDESALQAIFPEVGQEFA